MWGKEARCAAEGVFSKSLELAIKGVSWKASGSVGVVSIGGGVLGAWIEGS